MSNSVRQRIFLVVALLLCASISVAVFAQSTTEGGISGTVTDQSKAVVPNAKVTVVNAGTNRETTATTDEAGRFRVGGLQPGTYTVTVTAANFAPFKVANAVVEVGLVTNIEATLAVAGKTETVEVSAEAPVINTTSHDFSVNMNETAINELPINGRRWSEFAKMTPGTTPDGNYGLMSFRGISGLLNNSTIDGGDNNQAFFSEERGRTRLNYAISQGAIREFQVNTSNYSAEYGRAAGGVVNAVTKSGTNELHGNAFYYNRDNQFGAYNPFSLVSVVQNGVVTRIPLKPKDKRHQFGGAIGGPIKKDKLFFFFSYDQQKRNFPGVAAPDSPTFLDPITIAAPASCTASGLTAGQILSCRGVTQAQSDAALTYLRNLTGVVPRKGDQLMFLPKVDWRLSQNHTASVTYNRSRWKSPAGVQTQATVSRAIDDWGDDFVNIDSVTARLSSALSPTISNEARFQWSRDFEHQNSQTPAPGVPRTSPDGGAPQIGVGSSGGITIGRPNFLERAAYPDEHRDQWTDNMTVVRGKHMLKFGADINHVNDMMSNLYNGPGNYSYSTLADWISDFTSPHLCPNSGGAGGTTVYAGCFSSFAQAFGPLGFTFNTNDVNFYVNDEWRTTPRLTLNLGMRYEYEMLPNPQIPNPAWGPTQTFHHDKNNFGPRTGFAWDMFGTGKTVLRGGYGIYYGRVINATLYNAIVNTGMSAGQVSYTVYPTSKDASNNTIVNPVAPSYPNTMPSAPPPSGAAPNIVALGSNMGNPLIHQFDLVFEREVLRNTVASVSYLGSIGRQLPIPLDRNLNRPTRTMTYAVEDGPYAGQTFTVPVFTGSRPFSSFGNIVTVESLAKSRYDAFVAQVNRRMTKGLQFQANYTWSHALDSNQATAPNPSYPSALNPFDLAGEWGNSGFDVRHRVVFNAVYAPEFNVSNGVLKKLVNGFSIAPIVQIASGRAYTGGLSGNIRSNWLPSGVRTTAGGLEGNGGDYRIPLAGRNSFRYPRFENIDLRLSRRFRLAERVNLEVLAEAFNLFNHVNPTGLNTGMYTMDSTSATPAIKYVRDSNGNPTFGVANQASSTLWRERQVQFAARINF